MGENSKIEWTDHTFNPWIGCQKVSPGCDHCYAETQNNFRKWNGGTWGPKAPRTRTSEANWRKPLQWATEAREAGVRRRVFCASLSDWLDNQAPREWRYDLLKLIEHTPELDWLLLTKRIENYAKLVPWVRPPSNVWLGTTAEDQSNYVRRWAILRKVDAAVRFISYEPAIGPLRPIYAPSSYPDWIICGGESGGGARYMEPQWAADLKHDCEDRGIAFFMKQMTNKKPIPPELLLRQFPTPHR
jgi:protein gp37